MSRKWLVLLLAVRMLTAGDGESAKPKKNLLLDAGIVCGVTFSYCVIIPSIRNNLFRRYSFNMVWENFRDPIDRAIEGGHRDDNSFWVNYVGHPLSFVSLGLFLKARGHGDIATLAFTQMHNVVWEYVIEGGLWLPSGKDLVTDCVSSLAAIFVLNPLSDLGEKRLGQGRRRWGNRLLYWLNPFKEINKLIFGRHRKQVALGLYPLRRGVGLSLIWQPGPPGQPTPPRAVQPP